MIKRMRISYHNRYASGKLKGNVKNFMKKNERFCPGKHRMIARVIRGCAMRPPGPKRRKNDEREKDNHAAGVTCHFFIRA
jgi:hypothetical protein